MITMAENRETVIQRSLSEWWSVETEHVFQRIERWAAFARGYNRLRSQRWSKDQRQSTREDASWNASTRKSSVDGTACASQFYSLKQGRRKTQPEETKINCCGTFNYQSSSKLDSNCLETYRYDHSIYFKTIGDIRSDKRDIGDCDEDRMSISSEELVEWDARSLVDLLDDRSVPSQKSVSSDSCLDNVNVSDVVSEQKASRLVQNVWPIVNLAQLDLNPTSHASHPVDLADQDNRGRDEMQGENNNMDSPETKSVDVEIWKEKEDREVESRRHERMKRIHSFRKTRRSSRNVRRPPIVGENNVVWPGVLLNYTNNFDVTSNLPHD